MCKTWQPFTPGKLAISQGHMWFARSQSTYHIPQSSSAMFQWTEILRSRAYHLRLDQLSGRKSPWRASQRPINCDWCWWLPEIACLLSLTSWPRPKWIKVECNAVEIHFKMSNHGQTRTVWHPQKGSNHSDSSGQVTRSEPARSTTLSLGDSVTPGLLMSCWSASQHFLECSPSPLLFCMTLMRRLDSESGLQHLLLWGLRPGDGAFHLLSRLRGFEDPFALGDPELKNRMTSTGGLRKIAVKEKLQNYHGMPWTIRLSSWGLVCHFCMTPK